MDAPLLQTKFYRPPPRADLANKLGSNFISRPRLLERLDEGSAGKLTLISAGAGFGKTQLVSEWLDHVERPVAWLSLDEDDNDLVRFLTYLVAALQAIQPDIGEKLLDLLQASPLPPSHTLLTLLINDLAALPEAFILVLDDYHVIETKAIDQALNFFIDHLPPLMQLVVTSRIDPNLSLARLRANGQLNELRTADLRFTSAEAAEFLQQIGDLHLTEAEVAALDQRTEGWIAGLQMAVLSLRQREPASVAQFIAAFSGSHRYIMDYLIDEVLQQQPATVQTFLLYTSILDRLCGSLCDAVLGDLQVDRETQAPLAACQSQMILEQLERANLFLTPLDDHHYWYRYHPLFAELLRHRLNQLYPTQIVSLHQRASAWYDQAGLTGQAVQHALAAQVFCQAAALVEQVAPALIQRSELTRLLSWLDALPAEEVQMRALLGLYYGWSLLLNGQTQQAAAQLEAVEARLVTDEAQLTPEVQGYMAVLRAYLVRETGDLAKTITFSRQALAHLPAQDALLSAMGTLNLAIAYYLQGEFASAVQLLTENIATGQTAQRMANTFAAIYLKAQILRAQGALQQALQLCEEGLALIDQHGWHNFPAAGFVYVALGDLLRECNELTRAAEYLERGIELGQAGGHPHILIISHVCLAWLRQTQGDAAGSQQAIQTALQLTQQQEVSRFWPLPPAACYQARLWIAQGNLAAAHRWAQTSGLDHTDPPVAYLYEVDYLTLARLSIAQGDLAAAEALLRHLQRTAAAAERNGSLIEIRILQAITFAAQKRSEEALATLEQALNLAGGAMGTEGFVRLFLDEGAPLVDLLRQAVAQDRQAAYALHLLDALGEAAAAPTTARVLVEPLSERELEVLRRVAAGYSNNQIAQELVLAVSTVKKHVNNIYGKLVVSSRTQAVARARELGLL